MSKPAKKTPAATPSTETPQAPTELTLDDAAKQIADLQAQLAAAEAAKAPAPAPVAPAASPEQLAQIKSLQAALIASRRRETSARNLAAQANDEEIFEVRNAVACALSVNVTDSRGEQKLIQFEGKGASAFLTASQIAGIQDATKFFALGYLSAPEIVPPNANLIENEQAFIDALDPNTISARIADVTSSDALFSLYHFIESQRYEVTDNEVKVLPLPPKTTMVLHAVLDRLRALTGFAVSAQDAE